MACKRLKRLERKNVYISHLVDLVYIIVNVQHHLIFYQKAELNVTAVAWGFCVCEYVCIGAYKGACLWDDNYGFGDHFYCSSKILLAMFSWIWTFFFMDNTCIFSQWSHCSVLTAGVFMWQGRICPQTRSYQWPNLVISE